MRLSHLTTFLIFGLTFLSGGSSRVGEGSGVGLVKEGRPETGLVKGGRPESELTGRLPLGVSPSILAADFGGLAAEASRCQEAGCTWLHVDICDGDYVRGSLTLGPQAVAALSKSVPGILLDCHIAVKHPSRYIEVLARAGAARFTFQWEALSFRKSERTGLAFEIAQSVRSAGMRCGVSIARGTPAREVRRLLASGLVDLVDVLAVEPGVFGGQPFDSAVLGKVAELARIHPDIPYIAVDGGVTTETAAACAAAGANLLISGTGIFGAQQAASVKGAVGNILSEGLSGAAKQARTCP